MTKSRERPTSIEGCVSEPLCIPPSRPFCSLPEPRGRSYSHLCRQVAYPDEVVDGQAESEERVDEHSAAEFDLAEESDGLQPAEDLLDSLALPLADVVARMACRPAVDRARAVASCSAPRAE